MDKEITFGPEAKVTLKIEAGKISIAMDYAGVQMTGLASVSLDVEQFATLLKNAIPGKIDDTIIDLLVAAMKIV